MDNTARKKLIQEYYAKRAKDYDRQKSRTWKTRQGFGTEIFDEVLNALEGFGDKVVLEVGVGSGRNAVPLLEKVKLKFIGLDLSRRMLELAKAKMTCFRQDVNLILADAEHLPFIEKTCDAIVCMSTMHYSHRKEKS